MKEAREEITLKMAGQRGREMRHFSCKNEWKGALACSSIFCNWLSNGKLQEGPCMLGQKRKMERASSFCLFCKLQVWTCEWKTKCAVEGKWKTKCVELNEEEIRKWITKWFVSSMVTGQVIKRKWEKCQMQMGVNVGVNEAGMTRCRGGAKA